MKAFVSIKEAAEYLGVEYKTVYRLVKAGDIPAGKIGGVYRIKKDDLDDYFEKQKQKTLLESAGSWETTCSYCEKEIVSRLSVAGRCQICGDPICIACWMVDSKRFCKEHQPEPSDEDGPTKLEASKAPEPVYCSRCRRIIPQSGMIAGQCEHPSCEEPLCGLCWQDETDRFCAQHMVSQDERLAKARTELAQGRIPVLVSSEEARQRELAFLSRFDLKVHRLDSITSPAAESPVPVDSWDSLRSASEAPVPASLKLATGSSVESGTVDLIPCNCGSRYEVPSTARTKTDISSKLLILEAVAYSHLPDFLGKGFDTQRVSLPELVGLLTEYARRAEAEDCPYVLGLASPTGWDEPAQAYIKDNSSGHSFRHRLLMPVLIDLAQDAVVHNELDARLKPFLPLFSARLSEEEVEEVADFVLKELVGRDGVSVDEVVEQLMVAPDTVMSAFHHLTARGDYRLHEFSDLGVVISKG
jgi:excisionase family DNA binding protein